MNFRELECVVLARDLPEHGLRTGDLGTIVHLYSAEAAEVEFVRGSGVAQALVTLPTADLRPIQADDLLTVRVAR